MAFLTSFNDTALNSNNFKMSDEEEYSVEKVVDKRTTKGKVSRFWMSFYFGLFRVLHHMYYNTYAVLFGF